MDDKDKKSLDLLYEDKDIRIAYLESSDTHLISFGNGSPLGKKVVLPKGILKKLATCSLDEIRDVLNNFETDKMLIALEEYGISPEHLGAAASRAYMNTCTEMGRTRRNGRMYQFLDYYVMKNSLKDNNTNEEKYNLLEDFVKGLSKRL